MLNLEEYDLMKKQNDYFYIFATMNYSGNTAMMVKPWNN
jgi:hypothetical protein